MRGHSESDEEEYDDSANAVSLIAGGLEAVPDDLDASVSAVNLHGNFIRVIGGAFSLQGKLVELNLSSNHIEVIEGLGCLLQLRSLNLACNRISKVEGLKGLNALKALDLSHNRITDLSGFYELDSDGNALSEVRLKDNRVASASDLLPLRNVGKLNLLELASSGGHANPLCGAATYYKDVLQILPQVKVLDPSRQQQQQPGAGHAEDESEGPVRVGAAGADSRAPAAGKMAPLRPEEAEAAGGHGGGGGYSRAHVASLEHEARSLGEQMETLKSSFHDYESLRSLVQNLKEQQRAQLARQEGVLRQEMEIFVQEKDLENEQLRQRLARSREAEARLGRALGEAKKAGQQRDGQLKQLGEAHARATGELRTLEDFAEQLTAKVEVERALRRRAEMESQGVMKKLNASLSDLAAVQHKRSQLQERAAQLERDGRAMAEKRDELGESLLRSQRKAEEKEGACAALREKAERLNGDLNAAGEALTEARREKAALREELKAEFTQRGAIRRQRDTREVKDLLFRWSDAMEASCRELKQRVHASLVANEDRLNRLFILGSKLSQSVLDSGKREGAARREKREAEALLSELAGVSEDLQGQVAREHAEQQQLRKVVAKQARQLERLVPVSKAHHKLCIDHEALARRADQEAERAAQAERRCQELRLAAARATQAAEHSKVVSREELQRAEATLKQALAQESKLQHLQDELNTLGQVVKLKDTLLEDRSRSVEELSQQVRREQEDKGVIIESHSQALEQMKQTMDSLSEELSLQDRVAQQSKAHAERLARELEEKEAQKREKDEMLQYVRREIESLKRMFEEREATLRRECEAAHGKAAEVSREREAARSELQAERARVGELTSALGQRESRVAALVGDLERSKGDVKAVEGEMRQLLMALEDERVASKLKAQRVQSVLKELAIP